MTPHDVLLARRTVHRYQRDPIPEGALHRALNAAHHAPCHKLTWPWRFTTVGRQTREQILAVDATLKGGGAPLAPEAMAKLRAKLLDPPVLLVVSQVVDADPFRAHEDYAACACAIQNLCLSLAAEGIGSKWSTGKITRHPDTARIVGVDSQVETIIGFVWVGLARITPRPPTRPPLRTVLRELP